MNGWDLFTWISAVTLGISAVLIFYFFVREARSPIDNDRGDPE